MRSHPTSRTHLAAHRVLTLVLIALAVTATGCASTTPGDPLEPMNRRIHTFNETLDRTVLRPVAEAYDENTPRVVNRSVSNFFANLDDVTVLVNTTAQARGGDAAATLYRLVINTTVGLAGLVDVGAVTGQPKREADFGQTLGSYGVRAGPYLVIPLLGPSNFRDAPSRYVDGRTNPQYYVEPVGYRYALTAIDVVDTRASLLGASFMFEAAATDSYSFMRDAWSSRRANFVHDGDPPPGEVPGRVEDDDFDPFDDEGDDDLFD